MFIRRFLLPCVLLVQGALGFLPVTPSKSFSLSPKLSASRATSRRQQGGLSMVQTDFMTLTRFMIERTKQYPDQADLEALIASVQTACKTIANLVGRAGISDLTGLQGEVNVQGEEQKKLDVISNNVLKNALRFTGKLGVVASEEEDHPILVEEAYSSKYVAVFDPLDGSSNVDAAISTGTIFGIFTEKEQGLLDSEEGQMTDKQVDSLVSTLQAGNSLIAAGYCMYSSSVILVLTFGDGVNGFTLDQSIGEFVLTHPKIQIPKKGKIYSLNEANFFDWDPALQAHIDHLKKNKYSSRYIGSMVGDVHRTLLYGGLFGYPSDSKNKDGKLRLLYEAAPIGFIVEQAGGKASTGSGRILDINPTSVHQRVPTFLGSYDDVADLEVALTKPAGEPTRAS